MLHGGKKFNGHGGECSGGAKNAHSANAVISCCSTFCRYTISCLRTCGLQNSHRFPECPSTPLPCQKDLTKGEKMNKGFKSWQKWNIPLPHGSSAKLLNYMCAHNQPPSISQASKSSIDHPTWESFPLPQAVIHIPVLSSPASGTPSLEFTCLNEQTTYRWL